ncbi:MAG: alpha/beta hydrolase [Proteobacteria bacterium]|jgi:pimeloyl-ACP methyl ester carboxylesterase|nr:alpha/beta hydrolase [Pseudomonadota bacterium]
MENRQAGEFEFISDYWPLDPNKPTLVFIHGSGLTSIFWKSQVEALTEFANTVAIDLPGHGTSKGFGKDNITDYAQSVMEFIDQIEAPQPIPCGLSLGGAITQQLLLDYKEPFPAGILINTGARLRVNPVILETIEKNYDGFIDMTCTFAISGKSDTGKLRPEIEACMIREAEVTLGDFRACDAFDVMEKLSLIEVPVLVLTASDDNLTPVKYGNYLGENIRNAQMANIEDAGHMSPLEKPDEVNKVISDFLQQKVL